MRDCRLIPVLEPNAGGGSISGASGYHGAGRAGGDGRHVVDYRHLWDGGVFISKRLRELGIRLALGAPRKEVLHAALGRPFKLLAIGSAAGLAMGLLATRVLAFIVYQATPRDPFVLAGVVMAMSLLGLWQRGFRRNARFRSILRSCCAKTEARRTGYDIPKPT